MFQLVKRRLPVLIVTEPRITKELTDRLRESFILRATMGEVIIAEAPISRIGDLATLSGVVDIFEDVVPLRAREGLTPEAARLATLWEWKYTTAARRRPVTEKQVLTLMESLELEIINERTVRDRRTGEDIGTIEEGRRSESSRGYSPNPGCFWLLQGNSWTVIPGFFGIWAKVRGTSETRKCTSTGGMSSTRQMVDYIRVSVWNQMGAYAWRSRTNSSFVDGEDWEYVWVWDVVGGGAIADSDHYARWGDLIVRCSL